MATPAKWLLSISNLVCPGCVNEYDRVSGLYPESFRGVQETVRQAAIENDSDMLRLVAQITEEEVTQIAEAVLEATKKELSNVLAETLYYNDRDSDEILGYRVRRSGLRALEAHFGELRDRKVQSSEGDAG
jgi:hypothetical protein